MTWLSGLPGENRFLCPMSFRIMQISLQNCIIKWSLLHRQASVAAQETPSALSIPDLDYATVHKTREGGRITEVSCRVIFGTEESVERRLVNSPNRKIDTSYVERSNLDWRIWDAHLVRKSPTVARSIRWLKAKFAICVSFYNLIRPHGTLSRGQDRIFRPKTPAMVASVTDHPWSVRELLEYAVPCQ